MATWTITEHVGLEGLNELRVDWHVVADSMPKRLITHLWESHRAYLRHLASSPDAVTYLALRDAGHVRAIVPLEARVDSSLVLPIPVSGLPFSDEWPFGDMIAPEGEARRQALRLVLEHIRTTGDHGLLLVLGPSPAHSTSWEGLRDVPPGRVADNPQFGFDVIDCARPFEEVHGTLSKNFRGNLRRARNKLAKLHGVRFVSAREPSDLMREFEAFVEVEASGWKGTSGQKTAIELHPRKAAFYRDMVAAHGSAGRCRIDALYVEARCVASELSILVDNDFQMLKIGFDQEFYRYAPGQMLLEHTLRRCCEDPDISTLNLMSSAAWHRDWKATLQPLRMARIALNRPMRAVIPAMRFRFGTARRIAQRLKRPRR